MTDLILKQVFISLSCFAFCFWLVNVLNNFFRKSARLKKIARFKEVLCATTNVVFSMAFVLSLWCIWILWPYFASSHH